MTPTEVFTLTMSLLTAGALLYGEVTKRRAQKQQAAAEAERLRLEKAENTVESDDRIAARRLEEIVRLDEAVKELRADVKELQEQRQQDARTIGAQADELEATNEDLDHAIALFTKIKAVFAEYADRIEAAWPQGVGIIMPALTADERALLDAELPRRARRVRERT